MSVWVPPSGLASAPLDTFYCADADALDLSDWYADYVSVGQFRVKADSLATMTLDELRDFGACIAILSTCGFRPEIGGAAAERLVPERFRVQVEKD